VVNKKTKVMFKFIKQYADNMHYAAIYPIVSLLIFFAFFVGLLIVVKRMRKEHVEELANMPLQ
jgi:cytochrome c oxidase cbb3-type subunit IV